MEDIWKLAEENVFNRTYLWRSCTFRYFNSNNIKSTEYLNSSMSTYKKKCLNVTEPNQCKFYLENFIKTYMRLFIRVFNLFCTFRLLICLSMDYVGAVSLCRTRLFRKPVIWPAPFGQKEITKWTLARTMPDALQNLNIFGVKITLMELLMSSQKTPCDKVAGLHASLKKNTPWRCS